MLRTYKTGNPTVEFSKYEFNNKLLVGVTFFRVISGVTCTKLYIFFNSMWILRNVPLDYNIFIYISWLQNFMLNKN